MQPGTAFALCSRAKHSLGVSNSQVSNFDQHMPTDSALPLLFSCRVAAAQQAFQSSGANSSEVIRVSSRFVMIDALVENRKTRALIGDLREQDFQLSEDRVPQSITYVSRDQLPLSVVFLFDLTETVRSTLKPLTEGAREILAHLKPRDEAVIMVFTSHTTLLQDFTTDRSLAVEASGRAAAMSSSEGTFIHEDMYEALDQATKSTVADSRRVLLWLTDGTANVETSVAHKISGKEAAAYLHNRKEAMDKRLHSGIVVSGLIDRAAATDAFVIAANATPFGLVFGARLGDLKRYADATGGPVLNTGRQEIAARLALLIDQLHERYTVGYKPLGEKPEGTFCGLRLQLRDAAYAKHSEFKKNDIVVRAKSGYYR